MNEVDILRRAVTEIRKDYGESWQKDSPDAKFHLAVADWLEDEALDAKSYGHPFDVEALFPQSFAVARAYLGEPK